MNLFKLDSSSSLSDLKLSSEVFTIKGFRIESYSIVEREEIYLFGRQIFFSQCCNTLSKVFFRIQKHDQIILLYFVYSHLCREAEVDCAFSRRDTQVCTAQTFVSVDEYCVRHACDTRATRADTLILYCVEVACVLGALSEAGLPPASAL